ncbi:MAG: hypothetical protein HFE78_00285 [Clostridiales bacterium]|nr:hypothetical protein [Clostridiales bacterium]
MERMMKRITPMLLALVLALNLLCMIPVQAEEIVNAAGYNYTITPILSPFAYYLYVQTDNPDPTSFRLLDESSEFFTAEDKGEIRLPTSSNSYSVKYVDPGTYYNSPQRYKDVAYEDETTGRVAGGYIFIANKFFSDGGQFTLLQKTRSGSSILGDEFVKTSVRIACPRLETRYSYLIDTCTTESMSFFEKLDAVQSRLDKLAVYPNSIFDVDRPSEDHPYPLLASSPYPELVLNEHYNMYETVSDGLLLASAYPFILDSASFPGTMRTIAKTLEPSCEISAGGTHAYSKITFNNETKTYGGAGEGGYTPLRSDKTGKPFTFRQDAEMTLKSTVEDYLAKLMSYKTIANQDMAEYRSQIVGDIYRQTIQKTGGTWIRIATEGGFGFGQTFGYAVPLGGFVRIASDAWVDGRYINQYERVELNVAFESHPKADIIKHNVTYTDRNGESHTQDVLYSYNAADDNWTAPYFYFNGFWSVDGTELPPELILSRKEAEALVKGTDGTRVPETGLVYDGTEPPGTPFTTTYVTGITLPESAALEVDGKTTLTATVEPADAYDGRVKWTSSNPDIVAVYSTIDSSKATLRAQAAGTAVITATTVDGGFTATCTVTVTPVRKPIVFTDVPLKAYFAKPVAWAVENEIVFGTSDKTFSPDDGCTRAQAVAFLWRAAGKPQPKTTVNPFVDISTDDYYYSAVLWAVENGITYGTSNTVFSPDETCTRGQIVSFLYRRAGRPAVTVNNNFADARTGYYKEAVQWAVNNDITYGTSSTAFGPDETCTRGQIVTFLYRSMVQS